VDNSRIFIGALRLAVVYFNASRFHFGLAYSTTTIGCTALLCYDLSSIRVVRFIFDSFSFLFWSVEVCSWRICLHFFGVRMEFSTLSKKNRNH